MGAPIIDDAIEKAATNDLFTMDKGGFCAYCNKKYARRQGDEPLAALPE